MVNVDIILNNMRVDYDVNSTLSVICEANELYKFGNLSYSEYVFLIESSGDAVMSEMKQKFRLEDIPKVLREIKQKCKMKKLKDEFKWKEFVGSDGKVIKTITIDDCTVELIKNTDGVIGAQGTSRDGNGNPIKTFITINDDFFDLPTYMQRFLLYHEFAHGRHHDTGSDFLLTDTDIETMKSIVRDAISQSVGDARNKMQNGVYVDEEVQRCYEFLSNEYIKRFQSSGMNINTDRTKIIQDCREYIQANKRFQSIIKKDRVIQDKIAKMDKYVSELKRSYDALPDDSPKKQALGNKLAKANEKYTTMYTAYYRKNPAPIIRSHLTGMEVDADRYAVSKVGAKDSQKALRKLIDKASKKEFKALAKSYKKEIDAGDGSVFSKLRAKMDIDKQVRELMKTNKVEPNIRADIIKQRAKDEKAAAKAKEKAKREEEKQQRREVAKLAKLKKESVLNNKIEKLSDYFLEGYISEDCYDKCMNKIYSIYYD